MFAKSEILVDFIAKLKMATPIALYYDHHKPFVSDWITKKITEFYFAGHPTTDKQLNVTNVSSSICHLKIIEFPSHLVRKRLGKKAFWWFSSSFLLNEIFLPLMISTLLLLFQLFGDGWFLSAMDLYLRDRFAHTPSAPTYAFLYTHEGASSFTEYYQGDGETNYGNSNKLLNQIDSISNKRLFSLSRSKPCRRIAVFVPI